MPAWPTSGGFPQAPRVGTWRFQAEDIVSEFKPAVGPARRRRVVEGAQYRCTGIFDLTSTQKLALEAFWRDDCELGSLPFTMPDPGDALTVRTWEWAEVPRFAHITADAFEASVSLIRD